MNTAPDLAELSDEGLPSLEAVPRDEEEVADDAYSAPTKVGPMAKALVDMMMAEAEAPVRRSATPPSPVSEIRALGPARPQGSKPSLPPPGIHDVPRLFDESEDEDGDHLDPSSLFGPKQSGATVLLDLSQVSSVIDGLKQEPPAPTLPPTVFRMALESHADAFATTGLAAPMIVNARRPHPRWTAGELAVMVISFLVVAVPALYYVLSKMI